MATFQPPPTYADPVLVDEKTKKGKFNPIWLKWFLDLVAFVNASGGGGGAVAHNSTTGLQGGQANQFYHLTASEYAGTGTGAFVKATSPTFTAGITVLGGAQFITTNSALTNGAGVGAGTLATAPAAGNPTKWVGINDNGTVRYIPAW